MSPTTRRWSGAADAIEDALGPIELWVNDAFTGAIAFFDDVQPAEYERITMVTYLGFVNGTRAALKRMKPRDRGTVIQVGSALAFRGIPLQSTYCGAKHAIKLTFRTSRDRYGPPLQLASVEL